TSLRLRTLLRLEVGDHSLRDATPFPGSNRGRSMFMTMLGPVHHPEHLRPASAEETDQQGCRQDQENYVQHRGVVQCHSGFDDLGVRAVWYPPRSLEYEFDHERSAKHCRVESSEDNHIIFHP